jgi:hypothetical protein
MKPNFGGLIQNTFGQNFATFWQNFVLPLFPAPFRGGSGGGEDGGDVKTVTFHNSARCFLIRAEVQPNLVNISRLL